MNAQIARAIAENPTELRDSPMKRHRPVFSLGLGVLLLLAGTSALFLGLFSLEFLMPLGHASLGISLDLRRVALTVKHGLFGVPLSLRLRACLFPLLLFLLSLFCSLGVPESRGLRLLSGPFEPLPFGGLLTS